MAKWRAFVLPSVASCGYKLAFRCLRMTEIQLRMHVRGRGD